MGGLQNGIGGATAPLAVGCALGALLIATFGAVAVHKGRKAFAVPSGETEELYVGSTHPAVSVDDAPSTQTTTVAGTAANNNDALPFWNPRVGGGSVLQ